MLNNNIIKDIKDNVTNLMFEDAYQNISTIGIEKCWEVLSNGYCYDYPMQMYGFLMYLVSRNETALLHFYIFQLLIYIKPFFDDPYVLAYWHMKRALELEPTNIDYMRWTLKVFEPYPEKLITDADLLKWANSILEICPDDKKALEVKQNYMRSSSD
jgi:hypothetical protein